METAVCDPFIKMRAVKVMFADSKYDYSTNINGTRAMIADHFRQPLNMGQGGKDDMQTPIRIYFLDQDIMLHL
jgi:hypothetical protein